MSLILEALRKAEQSNGTSNYNHTPQAYPIEKKAINKKTLFLLITIACLSSAIITLLIIYMMDSNNKTSYASRHNVQKPTSSIAKETSVGQTTDHKVFVTQPPLETMPNDEHLNTQREPGFGHLTNQHNRKNRTHKTTNQPASTTQANNKAIAPAPVISETNLGTHKIPDSTETQYFSKAKNTQLADMEISVHMYSKTPTKRFVYINSTRYSENALISNGIVLYEITESGIILDVNGTLYRVPIKL